MPRSLIGRKLRYAWPGRRWRNGQQRVRRDRGWCWPRWPLHPLLAAQARAVRRAPRAWRGRGRDLVLEPAARRPPRQRERLLHAHRPHVGRNTQRAEPDRALCRPAEILRYLEYVTGRMDLRGNIKFSRAVEAAAYDEDRNFWDIRLPDGSSAPARFLITARLPGPVHDHRAAGPAGALRHAGGHPAERRVDRRAHRAPAQPRLRPRTRTRTRPRLPARPRESGGRPPQRDRRGIARHRDVCGGIAESGYEGIILSDDAVTAGTLAWGGHASPDAG